MDEPERSKDDLLVEYNNNHCIFVKNVVKIKTSI